MSKIALAAAFTALISAPLPARALTLSETDVDAIGRVVFAEAGNQPIAGKVAVLDTILNRLASGHFGSDLQAVIAQPHAFEPVTHAGGWRRLPPLTIAQRVELETILALKAGGHLGDVSGGALYFQNPTIVAARAAAGTVPPDRIGFAGMPATTAIADHTFYRPVAMTATRGSDGTKIMPPPAASPRPALRSSFVGDDLTAGEGREGETALVLPADAMVEDVAAAR
ncbi:MAG: cell wall hydrolase [Rhodospirillales bacterium]